MTSGKRSDSDSSAVAFSSYTAAQVLKDKVYRLSSLARSTLGTLRISSDTGFLVFLQKGFFHSGTREYSGSGLYRA